MSTLARFVFRPVTLLLVRRFLSANSHVLVARQGDAAVGCNKIIGNNLEANAG
jgi:hypothetical protein